MSEKDPDPAPIREGKPDAQSAPPPVSSPASETLAPPNSSPALPPVAAGDNRTFSQLLAGAMASPAGSPRAAPMLAVPVDSARLPVVAVPCFLAPASLLDSPRFAGQFAMTHQAVLATVTAQAQMQLQAAYHCSSEAFSNSFPQPTSIYPAPLQQRPSQGTEGIVSTPKPVQRPPSLSDKKSQAQMQLQAAYPCSSEAFSNSFPQPTSISPAPLQQRPSPGTDGIVSAPKPVQLPPSLSDQKSQAQMQLQAAYPCSSEAFSNSFPQPTSIGPAPLQQRPSPGTEGIISAPKPVQLPPSPSDQKSQSARSNMKTISGDGYNWRKYGQKQVKSSDRSRSYYKCTNANCFAKKKVESGPDGRITEIIYRGQHNHDPPQKTRCPKEKGAPSSGPSGENEPLDLPGGEANESDPSTSKMEQSSGNETPEQQLFCSSDCEGDAAIKTEEEQAEEPDPKRMHTETPSITPYPAPVLKTTPYSAPVLKTIKEPKVVVQSACDAARIGDGYRWRKYGQKLVKGNHNPRSYYRCTHNGCPVRKHVERASDDAKSLLTTYEGKHNHDQPAVISGNDQPAAALAIAAPAATSATKDAQPCTSDSLVGKTSPTPTNGESGGDEALESAQALLSIGHDSAPGEEGGGTNSDGMNRPLFSDGCTVVPVQNS